MRAIVNGEARDLEPGTNVADIVRLLQLPRDGRGSAVAINGEVVPRSQWPQRTVVDGDAVEVLTAVGGG